MDRSWNWYAVLTELKFPWGGARFNSFYVGREQYNCTCGTLHWKKHSCGEEKCPISKQIRMEEIVFSGSWSGVKRGLCDCYRLCSFKQKKGGCTTRGKCIIFKVLRGDGCVWPLSFCTHSNTEGSLVLVVPMHEKRVALSTQNSQSRTSHIKEHVWVII